MFGLKFLKVPVLFFACLAAALFQGKTRKWVQGKGGNGEGAGPGACGSVLQGDGGQCLSFDHGQATSIWVP